MTDEEKAEVRRRWPLFPVQRAQRGYAGAAAPLAIPWSVAEKAWAAYASRYGTDQSVERLAQRGGFGVEEMDQFYRPWRDEGSEIVALRASLARVEGELDAARKDRDAWLTAYQEKVRGLETRVVAAEARTAGPLSETCGVFRTNEWDRKLAAAESAAERRGEALRRTLEWARGGDHRRVPHEIEKLLSEAL